MALHSAKLKAEIHRLRVLRGNGNRPVSLREVGNAAYMSATAVMRLADGYYSTAESLIKLARAFQVGQYHFIDIVGMPRDWWGDGDDDSHNMAVMDTPADTECWKQYRSLPEEKRKIVRAVVEAVAA